MFLDDNDDEFKNFQRDFRKLETQITQSQLDIELNNVNLSEYFWVIMLEQPLPQNVFIRESIGFIVTLVYLFALPILLAKTYFKNMFESYGPVRYTFLMLFGLSMLSLPIKMYLRWFFNLKYIVAIPEYFFNI